MQIYLVGGAVRDKLLGLPVTEHDWVVVGATPQQMQAQGFRPVGKDFPVFLHPQTQEEYALARTERKSGHGYTGFKFFASPGVTLDEDLARRDLTINAMAQDESGRIIDPHGGQADLDGRQLRHVSPAFAEDPVRILRVARFAARYHALGFQIADETMALMRDMVASGEADYLVAERVWKELSRALTEPSPHIFIETLRQCGALARVIPELDNLYGVPQRAEFHPEIDTGVHTMMVLQQACKLSEDVGVRFAALMHDLGKAETPPSLLPRHHGHEQRSLPLITALCKRLAVPRHVRDLALSVAEYHTHCHRVTELRPSTVVRTLERLDAFRRPQRFCDFLLCCEADARGRTGFEHKDYPQAHYFADALHACMSVNIGDLMADGYEGAELGAAINRGRVRAVKAFIQSYTPATANPPSSSTPV